MRLFVALDLPRSLRARLSWMAGGLPGARWVAPENYHVTLRFIGELPGWRAEEVDGALASLRAPAFTLQLAGIGTHQKGSKVEALWAGVERSPALDHLQAKVETALQRAGLERERRRFAPHVTLARLDAVPEVKVAAWVAQHNLFRAPPTPVGQFVLYSSLLGKDQAVYAPEVEYQLGAGATPVAPVTTQATYNPWSV